MTAPDQQRKRIGRPPVREHKPGDRVPLATRVGGDIKAQIVAAAEASGRSICQEAELRLERSFREDRMEELLLEILQEVRK